VIVQVFIAEARLSQSFEPVLVEFELGSQNNLFFKSDLEICILSDYGVVIYKIEEAG
jgi:hypothetical protein